MPRALATVSSREAVELILSSPTKCLLGIHEKRSFTWMLFVEGDRNSQVRRSETDTNEIICLGLFQNRKVWQRRS
jgi:hypothetical protein